MRRYRERDDKTSQDVTHSSPAMTSPAETKREAANEKRKPAEKKEAEAPKTNNPTPRNNVLIEETRWFDNYHRQPLQTKKVF